MPSHMNPRILGMRLPLLLAAFFAIAYADSYTVYAPAPSLVEDMSPPSPPTSSTPPLAWEPISSPSPPPVESTPVSPTTPSTPSPPPPPPTPSPPPPVSEPVSAPPPSTSSPPTPPSKSSSPAVWTPVPDVNLMAIRQVGQFAVRIYSLVKHVDLVFVNVISGKTQPSNGGYIYQLKITVNGHGAKSPRYEAVVWGILGTTSWQLRSFHTTK